MRNRIMATITTIKSQITAVKNKEDKFKPSTPANRIVTLNYRTDGETGIKPVTRVVEIEAITDKVIMENISALLPAISRMIEAEQNSIVRELVGEKTTGYINSADTNIEAVISSFRVNNGGGRITSEYLSQWFSEELAENTVVYAASIKGIDNPTEEQLSSLQQLSSTYQKLIAEVTKKNTFYTPEIRASIMKVLALVSDSAENNRIVSYITERFSSMDKTNTSFEGLL